MYIRVRAQWDLPQDDWFLYHVYRDEVNYPSGVDGDDGWAIEVDGSDATFYRAILAKGQI
ncbi:hypothetical protein RRF57_008945 [Xylaria bambusicola]|uniref:Uncharacterized protein n=1 Tax=Xylaria bambusicola TaxID=326684 RepID=A0AAN7Z8N7_9PEZI